jgi:hypothetical protein
MLVRTGNVASGTMQSITAPNREKRKAGKRAAPALTKANRPRRSPRTPADMRRLRYARLRPRRRREPPNLMASKNRHDDWRSAPAKYFIGEGDGRRSGCDPVKTIEDRKDRQTYDVELRERQRHQRQATQSIIPEQQEARIDAVAQPPGKGRPNQAEHPDNGEYAGARHLRNAIVRATGDQMRVDEAVG